MELQEEFLSRKEDAKAAINISRTDRSTNKKRRRKASFLDSCSGRDFCCKPEKKMLLCSTDFICGREWTWNASESS